jgi:hypothetical protein
MGRTRALALPPIAEAAPDPVLIVVERTADASPAIAQVCGFLGIRVELFEDTAGIAQTLEALRPIAVLAATDEIDCAIYDLLMAVAGYDPALPVLLVTDDRDSVAGAVHGAHRVWQLKDLSHLARTIETRDLIDFLFHAGRKSDTGRMLPV